MKAREIKKSLKEDYDNEIRHYEEVEEQHKVSTRLTLAKIYHLERLMHKFFGINCNYIEPESEVNDVPF